MAFLSLATQRVEAECARVCMYPSANACDLYLGICGFTSGQWPKRDSQKKLQAVNEPSRQCRGRMTLTEEGTSGGPQAEKGGRNEEDGGRRRGHVKMWRKNKG